jgi:hypothetical protein
VIVVGTAVLRGINEILHVSSECFETFGETQVSLYVKARIHWDAIKCPRVGVCLGLFRKSD